MPKYTIDNFSGGQVNNRGPFNVEINEARLALNTDLSKRDGSLKRRDGYTQLGAAISSSAINGMGVFSFHSGSNATVNYTAAAKPDDSDPAWDLNDVGTVVPAVSGGILTLADTNGDSQANYDIDTISAFDNSVGITAEIRLNPTVLPGFTGPGMILEDGTKRVQVVIGNTGVRVFGTSGSNVANFTTTTTDGFHIYRATLKGSVANIYMDGSLILEYTTPTGTSNKQITFGDIIGANSIHTSKWDYVKYWSDGAWAPDVQEIMIVANGVDLYRWDNNTFNALSQTLTAGHVFMVDFLGKLFVSNGFEALRTTTGTAATTLTTGDAANAPVFRYIERFFDRIYGAYEDSNPDRVWFSSPPIDLVAHVRGTHTAATTVEVTSTKYIKAGDVVDVFTHATSSKTTGGDSNTVASITDEDTMVLNSALTAVDNDDIFIEDTRGTLGLKWDTSGVPAEDFMDFPGEIITGLKRFGDFLMVPCKLSMWAIDKFQNQVPVSRKQGSTSGRSLGVVNQALYYLNQQGIWEWTGTGEPLLISQDIQDFIDAISTSFLATTVAWDDNDSYLVYVDDLVVDGRTYQNVVIEYNTRFKNWQIHSLPDVLHSTARFAPAPGDTTFAYIGTGDGEIHRWRDGTSDDGTVIPLELETVDHYIGEDHHLKQINRIWVFAKDALDATLEISVDGNRYQSVGGITDILNKFNKTFMGHYFRFRIRHNNTNSPQVDSIIIDYTDKGVK